MTYHLKSLRNSSDISWTIESRPCTRCLDDYGLSNNLIYLVASPSKVDDPCSNSASNSLRMEGRGKQGIYRATYSLNCPTNGLPFTWGKTQTWRCCQGNHSGSTQFGPLCAGIGNIYMRHVQQFHQLGSIDLIIWEVDNLGHILELPKWKDSILGIECQQSRLMLRFVWIPNAGKYPSKNIQCS